MAQDSSQIAQLWALRENVAFGLSQAGYVYKYDISLPADVMYVPINPLLYSKKTTTPLNFVLAQ